MPAKDFMQLEWDPQLFLMKEVLEIAKTTTQNKLPYGATNKNGANSCKGGVNSKSESVSPSILF